MDPRMQLVLAPENSGRLARVSESPPRVVRALGDFCVLSRAPPGQANRPGPWPTPRAFQETGMYRLEEEVRERSMAGIIRVLIIHRNRILRESLAFVLAQQHNITLAAAVAGASEILGGVGQLRPDVIVMDLRPLGREGLREAHLIRGGYPEAKILMMGLTGLESDVLACIEAGAAGYLPQEASLEDLLNNIQAVAAKEALCSPKVAGALFSRLAESAREREIRRLLGLPNLTRRELEIIALVEEGLSNKEIAVHLRIEVPTVKNHIHNILEKLQLGNRREAARYARERGLLTSSQVKMQKTG